MPNRLSAETSPYLRQHRENPVDWFPWGDEAFEKARQEDKPVLLSVGYSACHWCHVMAHESFEDPETARLMNDNFVNVKVDREERPDVDAIYMNAVQAMTGAGGWPMTVALTPGGEPFFGGTYFPPEDRYGRPSFRRVLSGLSSAWSERREEVLKSAGEMHSYLERVAAAGGGDGELDPELPGSALAGLERQFDTEHGGFGAAPKFPPHLTLRFLLARPEERAREMAHATLTRMARGGIYDQVGGGFARYSVDDRWLVPHFEKMLYDNGQLLSRYSEAYRFNADPLYAEVVDDTVAWLSRELRAPEGAFYSALDADSEGEEGRFYVWEAAEFDQLLGEDAPLAREWFGVSDAGNFEGRNVLTSPDDPPEFARRHHLDSDELDRLVREWRGILFRARAGRVRPGLDDKVITSWNGLAIAGLADAGRAFYRLDYLDLAREAARRLRDSVWRGGRLLHVYGGGRAHVEGLLEDYSYLGLGLVALYRATFEEEWLLWALELADVIVQRFEAEGGGFHSTPEDGDELIVRPKGLSDGPVPADNAAAAELLVHVSRLTGDFELERKAKAAVSGLTDLARQHPAGLASTLTVIEFLLHAPREVAVIGDPGSKATRALLRIVQQQPLPYAVVAHASGPDHPLVERLPFLRDRGPVNGQAAAYVCEGGTCRLPLTDPTDLARELALHSR